VASHGGESLRALVAGATERVLIVAPFIKVRALRQCLSALPAGVRLEVFTRWRPDEIAAGVSDLEVWDEVRSHEAASLSLSYRLHAKLYRTESRCLIGSANVTDTALGWVSPPNLELLLDVPVDNPLLAEFERTLRESAVSVEEQLYQRMLALSLQFQANTPMAFVVAESTQWETVSGPAASDPPELVWLPTLRQPEDLFAVYSGRQASLAAFVVKSAESDLAVLRPPVGLEAAAFSEAVAIALLQMPVVDLVDSFVETSQRFGAVVDLLIGRYGLDRDTAVKAWQALMRWMLYFMPDRYERRVDHHTEMFERVVR
jgi:hypothetical protein